MDNQGKEGSFKPVVIALLISMFIALFWETLTFLKDAVHSIFNPTLGALLNWNPTIGMLIIVVVISIITTLIQKYTTDQETLRDLKKQQKEINKKSQEFKHDPQKMLEIQKELGPLTMKMLKLNARSIAYTAIPLILLFRWFSDYFDAIGGYSFFGFMSWIIFYILFVIIFGSIAKKIFKVV